MDRALMDAHRLAMDHAVVIADLRVHHGAATLDVEMDAKTHVVEVVLAVQAAVVVEDVRDAEIVVLLDALAVPVAVVAAVLVITSVKEVVKTLAIRLAESNQNKKGEQK